MKTELGDQFEAMKVTFFLGQASQAFFLGQASQAMHNTWCSQTVPFVFHSICLLFFGWDRCSRNMTIMIWNHSHDFPKLTMMETSLPPFINFIQQLMILQRNSMEVTTVLGFNCHNNATNVMSCYYCGSTCNCARIQIVLFPACQLENSNCTGQLDDRPDGNDCNAEGEVWRSHWCSQECSPQHRQREKKVPWKIPVN